MIEQKDWRTKLPTSVAFVLDDLQQSAWKLATLPAEAKPRSPRHRWPGRETRRKFSGRRFALKARDRVIVKQTHTGTVSEATVSKEASKIGGELI